MGGIRGNGIPFLREKSNEKQFFKPEEKWNVFGWIFFFLLLFHSNFHWHNAHTHTGTHAKTNQPYMYIYFGIVFLDINLHPHVFFTFIDDFDFPITIHTVSSSPTFGQITPLNIRAALFSSIRFTKIATWENDIRTENEKNNTDTHTHTTAITTATKRNTNMYDS